MRSRFYTRIFIIELVRGSAVVFIQDLQVIFFIYKLYFGCYQLVFCYISYINDQIAIVFQNSNIKFQICITNLSCVKINYLTVLSNK